MSMICGFIKSTLSRDSGKKRINNMISSLLILSNFHARSYSIGNLDIGILSFDKSFQDNIYYYNDIGLVVVFDGYLLGVSSSPAKFIHDLYQKMGIKFVSQLNGVFNLVIYDKLHEHLIIINDRYGMKPLFYYVDRGGLIFSSEVKAIIKDGTIKKEIDWQSWGEYFSLKYVLGNKTFFKNIYRLPNATILEYKNKKLSLLKYWDYQDIKVDHSHRNEFFIYKIRNRLIKAIKKFQPFPKNISCLLSGGYDSRCLSFLLKRIVNIRMTTYTAEHPTGKIDAELARKVARMLKVSNIYIKNPPDLYKKYLVKKIYLLDGMVQEHMWLMPLFDEIRKETCSSFDGLAGDLFLKGLFLTMNNLNHLHDNTRLADILYNDLTIGTKPLFNYFSPEVISELKFSPVRIKNILDKIGDKENKITIFFAQNRTKNTVAFASNSITGRKVECMFPFLENELVKSALSVPPEIKISKSVYLKALELIFPDFKAIPTTNDITTQYILLFNSLRLLSIFGLVSYLKLLHRLYYLGRTISKNDKIFLLSLSDYFQYPETFNKITYLENIDKVKNNKKNFDGFILNATEFLIWYNLFFVENKKIYSFINHDY